jgi:tRNA threonylcarbamoyl adenosine modification protein YeaZ
MKTYLVIDTATKESSISLLSKETFISEPLAQREQTKEIIPKIKTLLEGSDLRLEDLAGIAVCTGPGLFTGTRIGVMTAKTLSYASDIPLFPFNTFDLYKDKEPYALLDAKCGRAYLRDNDGAKLINHEELAVIQEKMCTLDADPFKKLGLELILTTKDIKRLFLRLEASSPTSYKEIEVFYPN